MIDDIFNLAFKLCEQIFLGIIIATATATVLKEQTVDLSIISFGILISMINLVLYFNLKLLKRILDSYQRKIKNGRKIITFISTTKENTRLRLKILLDVSLMLTSAYGGAFIAYRFKEQPSIFVIILFFLLPLFFYIIARYYVMKE
jgi:hypothetical protein